MPKPISCTSANVTGVSPAVRSASQLTSRTGWPRASWSAIVTVVRSRQITATPGVSAAAPRYSIVAVNVAAPSRTAGSPSKPTNRTAVLCRQGSCPERSLKQSITPGCIVGWSTASMPGRGGQGLVITWPPGPRRSRSDGRPIAKSANTYSATGSPAAVMTSRSPRWSIARPAAAGATASAARHGARQIARHVTTTAATVVRVPCLVIRPSPRRAARRPCDRS